MTDHAHPDTDLTDPHGEAAMLRRENERLRDDLRDMTADRDKWFEGAGAHHVASMREAQRADQNLVRAEVAEAALAASRAPDPAVNAGSCQPGDLISRAAALSAVERECNAWERNGHRAARQIAGCLATVIRALPAAPVAEAQPVAWRLDYNGSPTRFTYSAWDMDLSVKRLGAVATPLYAHPPVQPTIGGAELDALVDAAKSEAAKAMRKFPQPNYVISKVAEEAGEVVKAAIHCAEGRETQGAVLNEIRQAIAMLIRLAVEGDQVHGLPPLLTPDAITALRTQPDWKAMAERLREALIWCSGSDDYQDGGKARVGWLRLCAPLIHGENT